RDRQQRVQTQLDESQVRLRDRSVELLRQQLLQIADENPATFLDRLTSVQSRAQAARRPRSLMCRDRPCGWRRDVAAATGRAGHFNTRGDRKGTLKGLEELLHLGDQRRAFLQQLSERWSVLYRDGEPFRGLRSVG